MFERLTDRARKVMALANQEAQRFNHGHVGTEHVLLGLVKEGSGVGANVLKNMDIDLRKVRAAVEWLLKSGPDMVVVGKLPLTPSAKMVIEFAITEARSLNHDYVGTEHLLLGLVKQESGIAAHVLLILGAKLEKIRAEVLELVKARGGAEDDKAKPRKTLASCLDSLDFKSETKLIGDFSCRLTCDEKNQWVRYVRMTDEMITYHVTASRHKNDPSELTARAWNEACKATFALAEGWYASLLERREASEALTTRD